MNEEIMTATMSWLPILFMLMVFYFLLYRPQKKARQERDAMLSSLQRGTRIITVGGIYGTINEISDEIVKLQIAANVEIEISRSAIGSVVKDDKAAV